MGVCDINGNIIPSNVTVSEATVRTALINAVTNGEIELPTNTASGTLSLEGVASYTDWLGGVETAFNAMMADYKKNSVDGIPLFMCTDNHGAGFEAWRIPYNYDNRVFSLALGDFCGDYFNTGQIATIKKVLKPIANVVAVAGNHDVVTKTTSDERASYYAINDAFRCTDSKKPDNRLYQVVHDNLHGCKFVVVSGYHLNDTGYGMGGSYTNKVSTEEMGWLIEELSTNDGYDIIVLSHEPLGASWVNRDGESVEDIGYSHYSALRNVLIARKNRTSGTVIDGDGIEHSFDFSNMKSKCLCSFHGHMHNELYSQTDGWTEYIARSYSTGVDGCVCWALIDRNAMTLTIYRAGYENLVLNI